MSIFSFFKRKKQQATVKKAGGKPFRKDIQALRAFAVATVVLYHLWPNRIVGGFAGVDIFFVISGFLMTTSVMGHLKPHIADNTITVRNVLKLLAEFYARRIRRLVPAALTTLSGALILAYFTGNLTIMVTTAKNVIASATFWENWHLAQQSVDYLHAGDAATATEHFWSLSVEEQFYLMWPLLLVGATLLTINVVVLYKKQRISGIILPLTLLTLISFAYGYWLTKHEPSIAYFSTPARIWELMLGGIIAFLPTIKNYDLKLLMPHVGLAMCLYSVFFITGDGFPGWHALIPTLGTAMIIWAGIGKAESRLSFNDLFALKHIQWIGNISYSVYLWHFPLIVLLPVLIRQDIDGPHGRLIKVSIIVLSLILAQLSYMYVEETTRKVRLKLRYVYISFIVATGLVVGGGFVLQYYGNNQVKSQLEAMRAAALNKDDLCFGARAIVNKNKCGNPYGDSGYDLSIGPLDELGNTLTTKSWCNVFHTKYKLQKSNIEKSCIFGDTTSSQTIILLGDSHADQLANAFDYIGRKYHKKIYLFSARGCFSDKDSKRSPACSARLNYFNESPIFNKKTPVILAFLFRNYERTKSTVLDLRTLVDHSDIFLLEDTPSISPKEFNDCYLLHISCTVNSDRTTKNIKTITQQLLENDIIHSNDLISISDQFCTNNSCFMQIGGVPVYTNSGIEGPQDINNSHITASYSYSLGPTLEQKLKSKNLLE